jgi:hypothetical protein
MFDIPLHLQEHLVMDVSSAQCSSLSPSGLIFGARHRHRTLLGYNLTEASMRVRCQVLRAKPAAVPVVVLLSARANRRFVYKSFDNADQADNIEKDVSMKDTNAAGNNGSTSSSYQTPHATDARSCGANIAFQAISATYAVLVATLWFQVSREKPVTRCCKKSND